MLRQSFHLLCISLICFGIFYCNNIYFTFYIHHHSQNLSLSWGWPNNQSRLTTSDLCITFSHLSPNITLCHVKRCCMRTCQPATQIIGSGSAKIVVAIRLPFQSILIVVWKHFHFKEHGITTPNNAATHSSDREDVIVSQTIIKLSAILRQFSCPCLDLDHSWHWAIMTLFCMELYSYKESIVNEAYSSINKSTPFSLVHKKYHSKQVTVPRPIKKKITHHWDR